MDETPITLTTLILLMFIVVALVVILYHYLTKREQLWSRKYKEEKISLAAHKLFKTNGYMIHSGSEVLLSSSGSFKRFDIVDKESCKHSNNNRDSSPKHCTTPLWNLPQTDTAIPPQPLRPAPAPAPTFLNNNGNHLIKTVKFSFDYENEIHTSTDTHLSKDIHQSEMLSLNLLKSKSQMLFRPTQKEIDVPILEGPPSTRSPTEHKNSTLRVSNTVVPRPVVSRKSLSPINRNYSISDNKNQVENADDNEHDKSNAKDNLIHKNTNPFLDTNTVLNEHNKLKLYNTMYRSNLSHTIDGNPFMNSKSNNSDMTLPTSEMTTNIEGGNISTSMKSLNNLVPKAHINVKGKYNNPFTNVVNKVKGPYMLQKTISEDFLFRKIMPNNIEDESSYANGVTSWSFSRLLTQDESSLNLWHRNNSQYSLESTNLSSMENLNLNRTISCNSADYFLTPESNSNSNINIQEQSTFYTQITGYLGVGLHYDNNSIAKDGLDLTVSVLEAKGLVLPFHVDSLDTFVRIYLVPDQAGALQTTIVKNSYTPTYNESFKFWFKTNEKKHSLWFHLYHSGAAHTLIGEAEMEIGEMPKPINTWIPLTDSRKFNARWGELMFSLSYLPTAERLTIVVVKARNLQLQLPNKMNPNILEEVQQIFVKVYLMDNAKKILKKRTSMKRKDRCPVFNESVIFSLPPQNLTTAQIRLTVFGVMEDKMSDGSGSGSSNGSNIQPLGHIVAGSYATGKGLRHWHQMLSSLRKPVAMWHVLRRVTNQPIFTGGADAVVAAMQTSAQRAKRNSVI